MKTDDQTPNQDGGSAVGCFLAIGIFAMLFWGMCEADKYVDISIREREFKLHDARDGGFSGMR